ncbi:very short patch repair endonuclease [Phycicoccus sp. Root563]|uniref:very short patch repair endonuclease n=1 Tax=Phycicoccus sp. Root563 TaxID=1736562 RepID=UPI000B00D3FB|nr:very short patch repair endonuclease [Phycicoccus sp. Root563]
MSTFPRRETAPEMSLRRGLHAMGLRYRVHHPVPGIPRRRIDIAFTRKRVAVFVDGCFWHGCLDHGHIPKRNGAWWLWKLDGNVERDRSTTQHLQNLGWQVVRVWEHEPLPTMIEHVVGALRDQEGA